MSKELIQTNKLYNPQNEREQPPLVDLALYGVPEPKRKTPRWVEEEQLVYGGGNNEPLFFLRRCGGFMVDLTEEFDYWHSEDFIRQIKDFGYNIMMASFEKNHVIEEEFVEARKELVRLTHKHGLRLAVYIRGDQVYHDFQPDGIAGRGLYQRDGHGRIPAYGDTFGYRKFVCMHNPEVLAGYKETIRRAVCEIGVDALHFDGVGFGGVESYGACRCDRCRADFTDFLVRRYGRNPELARERFGHTHLENIEPPGVGTFPPVPAGSIVSPDWQEWISFRCTWSTMLMRDIGDYIYSLNPEVAVIGNGNWPAVKENLALLFGWDQKTYTRHIDIPFIENAYYPHITPDGKIIHKTREMKMARNENFHLISYCVQGGSERDIRIQMSFEAAFNRGRIPVLYWRPDRLDPEMPPDARVKQQFLKWLNEHWDLYRGLETHAEFTVWRSQTGLAFSEQLAFAAYVQIEQLLTEERLPFEICFDECLDALGSRKILVVPDVNSLTVGQANKIIEFVNNGGGLLTGRNTSLYDGWHRKRRAPLLKILMPDAVQTAGTGIPREPGDPGFGREIQYARSGRGRVVYFPSFVNPATQPPLLTPQGQCDLSLDLTNWRRPDAAEEIMSALRWLSSNRSRFRVDAPRGVLAEYYDQKPGNRSQIHIVNLNTTAPARNVAVRINLRPGEKIGGIELVSPDAEFPRPYDFTEDALGGTVTIDSLTTYVIVVISWGK